MGKDEKPVKAADIILNIPLDREFDIRNMLRKNENIWLGPLGEINVTEMRIGLVLEDKPYRSPPISGRAGKTEIRTS